MAIALRPRRFVIFNGHVIINNGASDLTDLRESGPNEGEKLLHVMPVTFSNFFLGIFFIVFTTTTKKKTAKCDGYMRHTANESAPKEQRRLL